MNLGEEKCVASVDVIKEHAKEANVAEDTAHTLGWVTGVVSLCVEESEIERYRILRFYLVQSIKNVDYDENGCGIKNNSKKFIKQLKLSVQIHLW